jgi:predicted peroxiredoxin
VEVALCKLAQNKCVAVLLFIPNIWPKIDHSSLYLCNSGAQISVCKFSISILLHKGEGELLEKCKESAIESESRGATL